MLHRMCNFFYSFYCSKIVLIQFQMLYYNFIHRNTCQTRIPELVLKFKCTRLVRNRLIIIKKDKKPEKEESAYFN